MTKDELNELFCYENGELLWKKSRKLAGCVMTNGYWQIMVNYKNHTRHRLVWIYHNGDIPEDKCIDHIDGNRANDDISNLRLANNAQNMINSDKPLSTNKYRGVSYCKRTEKYEAYIGKNRKKIHLGRYETIEEALDARRKAEVDLYGEFSRASAANA